LRRAPHARAPDVRLVLPSHRVCGPEQRVSSE
jgi:hypothetical protein